jgi:hypothetical protein
MKHQLLHCYNCGSDKLFSFPGIWLWAAVYLQNWSTLYMYNLSGRKCFAVDDVGRSEVVWHVVVLLGLCQVHVSPPRQACMLSAAGTVVLEEPKGLICAWSVDASGLQLLNPCFDCYFLRPCLSFSPLCVPVSMFRWRGLPCAVDSGAKQEIDRIFTGAMGRPAR